MRLFDPAALLWLLLIPMLLAAHLFHVRRRRRRLESAGDARLFAELIDLRDPALGFASVALLAGAVGCIAVALARPQWGMRTVERKRRGMDVVIALDLSRSMLARDVIPSRLSRAKIELGELIDSLAGDRIGLVGFTSVAIPFCPLTIDHALLRLQLKNATPTGMPLGGTTLSAAIVQSQQMLTSTRLRDAARNIVIVTDGEDHGGSALEAARQARAAGIEVHVIGVGSTTGEPIPILDRQKRIGYVRDASGQTVVSQLDARLLKAIAKAGGGLSALPGDAGGLESGPVAQHLLTLKRADREAKVVRVFEERYQWALMPAFVLLLLATFLRPSRSGSVVLLLLLLVPSMSIAAPFEREDPDVRRGNDLLANGSTAEAVEAYEQAIARTGALPALKYDRGLGLLAAKELQKAAASLAGAADATDDPKLRAKAAFAQGNALRKLGRLDEAIASYKRALMDDPAQTGARRNLEVTQRLAEMRRPPDARRTAGVGVSNDPQGSGNTQDPSADKRQQTAPDSHEGRGEPAQPDAPRETRDTAQPTDNRALSIREIEEILDALQEQERVLKRRQLLKKFKRRKVTKDW